MVVVNVSLLFDLDLSFFCLETSPHCEMVPGTYRLVQASFSLSASRRARPTTYLQPCAQLWWSHRRRSP